MEAATAKTIREETRRRRTFAIISHPDAGKTTLTEKLLLYSGMIRTAGMVGGRKSNKSAASDWMSMEQERGISITASAMQFTYKGTVINVLDTPGHQDFSEDTYRTLTAADSAIMVIDAAKGVEAQTRKLFEVCRMSGIPVLTFVNKMDMPGQDPIDLMAEVEEVLGIEASPYNWPIGSGKAFAGVVHRADEKAYLYRKIAAAGSQMPEVNKVPLEDAAETDYRVTDDLLEQVMEDVELLEVAGNPYTHEAFLNREITPVFFGSALTGFGVEMLFDVFVDITPPPSPRPADHKDGSEIIVDPVEKPFSAYVFKLQANMDPRHRDCVAFMRINSGRYERNLQVKHDRLGRQIRLSRPHSLMVDDRKTIEEAYPGDVIGVMNPGLFAIGDTVSVDGGFQFKPLPQFQPELFSRIRPSDFGKRKSLDKGLKQLVAEGAIQLLEDWVDTGNPPIVAAVGQLQFEVLQYRLKDEYKVGVDLQKLPYDCSAWVIGDIDTFKKPINALLTRDQYRRPLVLFSSTWEKDYAIRENPKHQIVDYAT
ncbi:MAG: peptide chain release factor 3 [Bacteroidota bacterium]